MKTKMKNRYLVASPLGCFLLRCDTMDQVSIFVEEHFEKCRESFSLLTNFSDISTKDYQVRDLTDIPTFEEYRQDSATEKDNFILDMPTDS